MEKKHNAEKIGHKEPVHKVHEIKTEHKTVEKKQPKQTMFVVMAVALGLLILISGVQAFELMSLKNKLNSEITTLSVGGKSKVSTGGNSPDLASNLNNLPTMVGGC